MDFQEGAPGDGEVGKKAARGGGRRAAGGGGVAGSRKNRYRPGMFSMRLPHALKADIRQQSKSSGITMSKWVRRALENQVASERGHPVFVGTSPLLGATAAALPGGAPEALPDGMPEGMLEGFGGGYETEESLAPSGGDGGDAGTAQEEGAATGGWFPPGVPAPSPKGGDAGTAGGGEKRTEPAAQTPRRGQDAPGGAPEEGARPATPPRRSAPPTPAAPVPFTAAYAQMGDGRWRGHVAEIPDVGVEAPTLEEARPKLAHALATYFAANRRRVVEADERRSGRTTSKVGGRGTVYEAVDQREFRAVPAGEGGERRPEGGS